MNPTRKIPVTHKDITLVYMLSGCEAVENLLVNHTRPVEVLDRVIKTLESAGQQPENLRNLQETFRTMRAEPAQRGRKPVVVGSVREYSVQALGSGECFVRIPLTLFGKKKGELVTVSFNESEIVIAK